MKKLLAFSGLVLAAAQAYAVEQPYLALDYVQLQYDSSAVASTGQPSWSVSPGAARLRMGTDFSKFLGTEAHLSLGTSDDEASVGGGNHAITVDAMYTLALTARMPIGNGRLYAFGGYSYLQASWESRFPATPLLNSSSEKNDDGASYGVGLALPIGGGWLAEVDYSAYINKDAYTLMGVGVGVRKPL